MPSLQPPKINPVWSSYRGLRYPTTPLPSFKKFREKFGNTYQLFTGAKGWALVTERADIIDHVLRINNKNYNKSPIVSEVLAKYIGNGLLTIDGEFWRKQRKLIQPGFSRERLSNLINTIDEEAKSWVNKLPSNEPFDIYDTTVQVAMQIIAKVLFTDKISEQQLQTIAHSVELGQLEFAKEIRQPILAFWRKLTNSASAAHEETRNAVDILLAQIQLHRAHPKKYNDLLQMLIDARYEDGGKMPDSQLIDEILVLILAGHETTAITLACTLHLLAKHPEWQSKVREEWGRVVGESTLDGNMLRQLPVLTAVINEGLRLYPPAYLISRIAIGDDEIAGVTIQAGQMMILNIYGAHRNAINFDMPKTFDPSRYLERRTTTNFAFGGGSRMCVGYHLAIMELQITIGRFLASSTFVKTEQSKLRFSGSATLRPNEGVWLSRETN